MTTKRARGTTSNKTVASQIDNATVADDAAKKAEQIRVLKQAERDSRVEFVEVEGGHPPPFRPEAKGKLTSIFRW